MKDEVTAMFVNFQKISAAQHILIEMEHSQKPVKIKTDNSIAEGFVNEKQ